METALLAEFDANEDEVRRLLRKTVLRDQRDFLEASREFTICLF